MVEIGTKLGFNRIVNQIADRCTTVSGEQKLRHQNFSQSEVEIEWRLAICDELRQALLMETGFPADDFVDTNDVLLKLRSDGAFLEIAQVITLRRALTMVRDIERFLKDKEKHYPVLIAFGEGVDSFPELINHIDSIVDRHGEIRDSASPELHTLRRAIRDSQGLAEKKLRQVLQRAQQAGIVGADASLSIREGRAVIPVDAANKRKLHGFVHDESATGKTVYIEPVEVVELNNQLRELEYAEYREIVRILTELTETIRPDTDALAQAGDFLTTMDMVRAKARWAVKNGCVKPIISHERELTLRNARHPLLIQTLRAEGKEVVPLDMQLTPEKRILLISGPNAGGKSVCLKTVGLLQIMFQSGFLIPASENSELMIFDRIFIDIGDEQSIENDLSTYSSHLHNMKRMLYDSTERTLVLIDEFGTGTEPVIGGAIAESILERLEQKQCYGVITTHYSNLKYYASNAAGIINGGMTFDVQNIEPLFKLEMGTPGSSFAIEIARKIGMPEDIIRAAAEKAGSDHVKIERLLREIARDKLYWERKRDKIRATERRVDELEERYAADLSRLKQERAAIIKDARESAKQLTGDANRQIENTIREIRESQADREKTKLIRRRLDDFKESIGDDASVNSETQAKMDRQMELILERRKRKSERKPKEKSVEKVAEKLVVEVGAKVRIAGQDMLGEVVEISGKKAKVAFGQVLTTVEIKRLEAVSNAEFKRQNRPQKSTINVSSEVSERRLNFSQQIDVRGMRVHEALEEIRDYVDNAMMVGASEVRILHGKGTGALKEEIRKYLRGISAVQSAQDEHVDRGGAGITVVAFGL